jgi:type I restriction enzyme S subunit
MGELYVLPEGWEWKKLIDIVRIGCERGFKPTIINDKVPFIGMTDIDKVSGRHTQYVLEDNDKVSKGKTKFQKNAVLLGKITPCTQNNKTTIVPDDIDGGYATTEVYALHCLEKIIPLYLNYFVRSKKINEYLVNSMIGATGRQRVPSDTVKNLDIPLPPLQEQKRIVAKLDSLFIKIDQAIALHQQNIDEAEGFMGSVLNEVFGELEGKGIISTKRMNECFIVKDGTHDSPKYIKDNGYPLFTSKNLKEYGIDRSNFKLIKEEDYSKINQRSKVDKGDLLFAMIGTIGNPTLVDFEPDFAIKNVALFKSLDNKSSMEYLRYYLMSNFVISKMRDEANGATQKFVGLTYLRNFPFPYTSIKTQQKTVTYLDQLSQKTETLKQVQTQKMESLKALKASLLDQAFRGEI